MKVDDEQSIGIEVKSSSNGTVIKGRLGNSAI
jgi:hypothetical protein